jgi:hypothetical protein
VSARVCLRACVCVRVSACVCVRLRVSACGCVCVRAGVCASGVRACVCVWVGERVGGYSSKMRATVRSVCSMGSHVPLRHHAMCPWHAGLKVLPKSRKDLSFHFSPDAILLKLLPGDAVGDAEHDTDAGEVTLRDVNLR